MAKYAAFGATLGVGIRQVERATVVGTITLAGNATVIVTAAGMTGSPITKNVAVLLGDVASTIAEKIRTAMAADGNITALFDVSGSGSAVNMTRKIAAVNDGTLNISVENGSCTGITNDTSSDALITGVASASVAYIKSLSGPGLTLDVEDVTTHDSTDAWEEVVSTILRTGEMTMELVYDPNAVTHSAGAGLLDYVENRTLVYCKVTFVNGYDWYFAATVSNFEPDAPHEGALTATVSFKITGKPILV